MTNDLRERVARALEGEHILDLHGSRIGMNHLNISPKTAELLSQVAISAMGLPTREQVEAALDDFNEAIIMEERGFCSEKAILAERQRLLAMIPMTEATDDR